MNIEQKLTAIRDLIQQDVGNRGLARDPVDNLITACPDDFANACQSIATHSRPVVAAVTGFFIPAGKPPTFETDGPLGSVFLARALHRLRICSVILCESDCRRGIEAALLVSEIHPEWILTNDCCPPEVPGPWIRAPGAGIGAFTHFVGIERPGPALDGEYHTMSGRTITDCLLPVHVMFEPQDGRPNPWTTIGIGDGGNEIGMGKIRHETIVKNIPKGDLIHCRVPTDHLIVAGVSNWGAYALAAGVALLRGTELPAKLFDPDRERAILQKMIEAGPQVDGVTGQQTATVDGLSWDDYIKPLVEIGRIMRA